MKYLLTTLMSILILSGCSLNQTKSTPAPVTQQITDWPTHVQNMLSIKQWQADAKFAISANQKTKSARLSWKQDSDVFDISFSGPFGQGGPRITGDKNSATLYVSKEQPVTGSNTSTLLQQKFGWQLPVENAKYWMLGIPSPETESNVILKDERLVTLTQDNWTINYSKYILIDNNYRPTRIIITRGDLKILLIVYKWHEEETLIET